MATHSSVLAWRIPGTGEPCGLLSMGSHRVGHDWSDLAAAAAAASGYTYPSVYKHNTRTCTTHAHTAPPDTPRSWRTLPQCNTWEQGYVFTALMFNKQNHLCWARELYNSVRRRHQGHDFKYEDTGITCWPWSQGWWVEADRISPLAPQPRALSLEPASPWGIVGRWAGWRLGILRKLNKPLTHTHFSFSPWEALRLQPSLVLLTAATVQTSPWRPQPLNPPLVLTTRGLSWAPSG